MSRRPKHGLPAWKLAQIGRSALIFLNEMNSRIRKLELQLEFEKGKLEGE